MANEFALTNDNYHSLEANQAYMSCHQWAGFMECPARAVAELNGAWHAGDKVAFLQGAYIDIALLTPAALPAWWEKNKVAMIENGLLSKSAKTLGKKLAPMILLDNMIERAKNDRNFMEMLKGEPQVIETAEFAGYPWRIAMDVRNTEEKRVVDLKSTKSLYGKSWFNIDTIFDKINRTSKDKVYRGAFMDEYRYFRQMAVYREVNAIATGTEPDDWSVVLAAVSKEKPTDWNPDLPDWRAVDLALFDMNDPYALDQEIEFIQEHMATVMAWKLGYEPAIACGRCAFCVAHRKTELQVVRSCVRM